MKVFVVNCGSSSIKYQLFDMNGEKVLAKGLIERIGSKHASLKHVANGQTHQKEAKAKDHTAALKVILEAMADPQIGVISSVAEIDGVGHRVVHGGEAVTASARVDERIIELIRRTVELAPLHNPPNLAGIEGAMEAMPNVPHVAVFDTAFLATMPAKAHRYAVPEEWYAKDHVRKYGFHGTSHRYVTLRTAELLGKSVDKVNLVTAHLGNGCSITAVQGGKAVDHSMGMTPLEGLVMGTRCGDIDPAIVLYMLARGHTRADIDRVLNKESGLLGVSGLSNDMRDLLGAVDAGNERAALAVEMFVYRVVKYVAAYYTILPSVDAVVLTGGVGENSLPIRRRIVQGLARLGAALDDDSNLAMVGGKGGPITKTGSLLPVWVVPTNEELMIARDTAHLVNGTAG